MAGRAGRVRRSGTENGARGQWTAGIPVFEPEVLAGRRLEIVVRGKATTNWPFELADVEVLSTVEGLAPLALVRQAER